MIANETTNVINDLTARGLERATSLGELNLRVLERVAARQMDTMSLLIEHGARLLEVSTSARGYNALFAGQVEAAKALGERLMTESRANMALAGEVRDDYRDWLEKGLAEVGADLRRVAPGVA